MLPSNFLIKCLGIKYKNLTIENVSLAEKWQEFGLHLSKMYLFTM